MELPEPARYAPWSRGVYEVAPALKPLGTNFGNGDADRRAFQIDREFARYRDNKLAAIKEGAGKYVAEDGLMPEVARGVVEWMTNRLCDESPTLFRREGEALRCALTGETVSLIEPTSALFQLMLQVQEDLAVVAGEWGRAVYLNVCAPSHWAPAEKAGGSFVASHAPVPGFGRVSAAAGAMVEAMIRRGPFVRFVWGVESDDRLNHHPEPPPGADPRLWDGRRFEDASFWLRVERQVIWGLPELDAAVFLIRPIVFSGAEVLANEAWRTSLLRALESMSPEAREYKGIRREYEALVEQVEAGLGS